MNEAVLITGASGRIGSTLARAWAPDHPILRLTDLRPPEALPEGVPFEAADITDAASVARVVEGVEAVIHLAGHPNSREWAAVERLNMMGSRIVFEAAIRAGARRLVYASSIHAVGLHPAESILSADLPLAPDSPYGVSKAYGETLLEYLCHEHGVSGCAIRICSFRSAPTNARELRTWLSPGDMVRLADACLQNAGPGYTVAWGLSANRRASVDREAWERIGYQPQDEAEDHLAALAAAGVDVSLVSEFPLLGGHFVSAGVGGRR